MHLVPVSLHVRLLKAMEEESRAKSELLASFSQEVRTAIHEIIGMMDAILAAELTPEQRADLSAVRDSANALLKIVDAAIGSAER